MEVALKSELVQMTWSVQNWFSAAPPDLQWSQLLLCLLDLSVWVMNRKLKKLTTSLELQIFWDDNASVVKNTVFLGGSSLSAQTYRSLADVQKMHNP
jgi:hypothetical protein